MLLFSAHNTACSFGRASRKHSNGVSFARKAHRMDDKIEEREWKPYHPFSPSIDRICNDKGYVKGNVWIVSHKANTMKNNGTAEEFAKIARNLMKKTV